MPQMAPLSWLNLMIMFIIIFMMMNALNYFSFLYKTHEQTHKKTSKIINWKW